MTDVPNPPAFPHLEPRDPSLTTIAAGMTLRDWFAGQALAGVLAGGFADTIPHDDANGGGDAARFAFMYADAMLLARTKSEAGECPK